MCALFPCLWLQRGNSALGFALRRSRLDVAQFLIVEEVADAVRAAECRAHVPAARRCV
jgi:hypothetical protein